MTEVGNDVALPVEEAVDAARADAVQRAVKVWTGELVDLSGRNNLLFFRDLRVGTLDLASAQPDAVASVLTGKTVPLSRLFPEEEARADAVKRARTVRNKAEEHFEERGLQTLYLACGMATWTNPQTAAVPAAPVLLCPMRLVPRGAAQEDFDLALTGDLEVNPTLLHKLAVDFECRCDPEELLEHAGIEGAIDTSEELTAVYEWLTDRAARVPGFAVAPRLVLGNFSYAKLPMVNDLEQALDALVAHDLIAAIAGHEPARAALAGAGSEVLITDPDRVPLADEFLVLDADASQSYVINAAVAGQNLIVKGPPGTGKSQTIANLIASLMARGQKVLFVAEKRAAIDAVLQRLHHRGLDDLVLDLHGGAGSRRKIAQALSSTLAQNAAIPKPDLGSRQRRVEGRREELNERVAALHEPRAPWNISVHEAQVRLLATRGEATTAARFRGPVLDALSADAYEQCRNDLDRYVALGGLAIDGGKTPWASATIVSGEEAQAANALAATIAHRRLPDAQAELTRAATATGLTPPSTVDAWSARVELWAAVAATLDVFADELFDEDLSAMRELLTPMGEGGMRRATATLTSGEFRNARKRLKALLREGQALGQAELYAALAAAADQQQRWGKLSANGAPPQVPGGHDALVDRLRQLLDELGRLDRYVGGQPTATMSVDQLQQRLEHLLADQVTLAKLPELHRLRGALTRMGLGALLEDLASREADADQAVAAFEHAWLQSLLEAVTFSDYRIGAFDGQQHHRVVQEFRDGDAAHIETSAQRVRRLCAERAVQAQDEFEQEAALVQYQAGLKRKHLAIRQLFGAAPNVLTALRPCWAMSPLVVSQLLPADRQYFDVVIFDEASQITPADAIPAILRGKRLVVAGDDRQLPPTAFFSTSTDASDSEPEHPTALVVGRDFESILDALGAFVTPRMLIWHYRSHDERLIAFSNAYFYDRALTTFPGVTGETCLQHVLVPFQPGEIGSDQSGAAEVERVVDLVLEHARERPDESLGVIAMGIKHADRIDEHLRRRLAEEPGLEEFFDERHEEKFFVKNLERVQGDERDAIILSVGYGKSPDGRLLYRFGPLNQQGGERRLNVAVTRAKKRMTLVSSFAAADMDPNRSSTEGVRLLRAYLQYAESRGRTLGDGIRDKPALNPFEIDVRDALTRAGVPLVAQYGASGYWIDYAAQHPTQPGRMVLAIECDGAAYHSSPTARDRDRLRQQQLERLGWRFHRIWSQDWFHFREREIQRAVDAYHAAVATADRPPEATTVAETPPPTPERSEPAAPGRGPLPFTPWGGSIEEYSHSQIVAIVRWIESDTLLRTQDQLLADVIKTLGFQKRGKRIVAAIEAAIADVRSRPHAAPAPPAPASRPPALRAPRRRSQPSIAWRDVPMTVLDVETTGLSARNHRILEIALVRVEPGGRVSDGWTTLLNPQCDIGATHIHGIHATDIAGAPRFEQVAGDIISRIAGTVVVAHNARFDASFLRAEFQRARITIPTVPMLCTLALTRQLELPLSSRRLTDCCAYFDIDGFNAHSALADAQACAQLTLRYIQLAEQHGPVDLDDLDCALPPARSAWPSVPPSGLVHLRRTTHPAPDPGYLGRLVRSAPAGSTTSTDATAYLEVLDRALEDRRLTHTERDDLAAVAADLGLTPHDIAALHREYLAGLMAAANADGIVTPDEQHDLARVRELLGSNS